MIVGGCMFTLVQLTFAVYFWLLSCILPVSGLGKSAVSVTVISNGKICGSISHIQKTVQTAMPSFLKKRWISSLTTGLHTAVPPAGFFRNRRILPGLLILFISRGICVPTKSPSAGNTGLPATLSVMLLEHTFMKTGRIF